MHRPADTPERYRGRFAPSPTGPMHFGSLLAAMGSFLQARSQGGDWLVRIEDLDPPREVEGAAGAILGALERYGFSWDDEPEFQSSRAPAYDSELERLRNGGHVYACRCSRREIADLAQAGIDGPVYPGICRHRGWSDAPGHALRFQASPGLTCFQDALQGTVCHDVAEVVGDFIVRRRDGLTAYQLAVVVDDAMQGITEVVRGCDLINSTPRQIQIQRALGLSAPRYMHLPVAVNAAGKKLSKQTGAAALDLQQPLPTLVAAARTLNQQPPPAEAFGSVAEFWLWAVSAWTPGRLAGLREVPAPGAAFV